MLLPHGFEGQGAEHSSCRIERFLQMADDDEDDVPVIDDAKTGMQVQHANWQVLNVSTPANFFHALRRQVCRNYRKPMVIAVPKSLLRLKACTSSLEDMAPGTCLQRVIPERDPAIKPENVDRLIFCSGKIYYELVKRREELGLTNVAIVTIEHIAPFPFDKVLDTLKTYDRVDHGDGVRPGNIIWCQEEPKNMGPWSYVKPRFVTVSREGLDKDTVVRFVGRRTAASPATGFAKLHEAEQLAVVENALTGEMKEGYVARGSVLLGHTT